MWRVTLADGRQMDGGSGLTYPAVPREQVVRFELLLPGHGAVFACDEAPAAVRRRIREDLGGREQVCWVVVLRDRVAFAFEPDGPVLYRRSWGAGWLCPIDAVTPAEEEAVAALTA